MKVKESNGRIFSVDHPDRAVAEVMFGYALYLKTGKDHGRHVGLADNKGAFKWLNGKQLCDIAHYKVYNYKETK